MVTTRARSIKFRQIFLPTGGMSGYKDVITSRKMGKHKNKPLQHHHVFCCSCRFPVLNPTFWKRSTNFYTFNDFRWMSSPRFFHDFSHYFSPVMPTAQAQKKKKTTYPTYLPSNAPPPTTPRIFGGQGLQGEIRDWNPYPEGSQGAVVTGVRLVWLGGPFMFIWLLGLEWMCCCCCFFFFCGGWGGGGWGVFSKWGMFQRICCWK